MPMDGVARPITAGSVAALESLSVASISAPAELSSRVGTAGQFVRVYSGNVETLYFFVTPGPATNSPYVVAASGSGKWVAVAGRYANNALSLASTLATLDTTEASAVGTAANVLAGGLGVALRSFLGTIGATFKGNVLAGVQDGTSAVAGQVGEVITAAQSTYTNLTSTATYQQLNTIALTAGDWDVRASVTFFNNGATMTANANSIAVIATATASATGAVEGQSIGYASQNALTVATGKETLHLCVPISVAATTNYYLNAQSAFTVGNPQYVSRLWARRIR